jgi:hypothetical protein
MNRKTVGAIVAVAGVVLLVISALADPIGLGDDGGFGWKQTTGVIVGAALAVVGLALIFVRR